MTDCIFCHVPELKASNTPVWLITHASDPIQNSSVYKSVTVEPPQTITKEDFVQSILFTPAARLTLSIEEATNLLTHKKIWNKIIKSDFNHAAIFTDITYINDAKIAESLDNAILPRDWDIIIINNNQYILTKRAANILQASSRQFHNILTVFIKSIPGLKIVFI